MDISLTPEEERRFQAWRHSPSVFSSSVDELVIAYKLGKHLHYPPSRVLKALRGLEGLDREMIRQVEDYVNQDASLSFAGDPPARLVVLENISSS